MLLYLFWAVFVSRGVCLPLPPFTSLYLPLPPFTLPLGLPWFTLVYLGLPWSPLSSWTCFCAVFVSCGFPSNFEIFRRIVRFSVEFLTFFWRLPVSTLRFLAPPLPSVFLAPPPCQSYVFLVPPMPSYVLCSFLVLLLKIRKLEN